MESLAIFIILLANKKAITTKKQVIKRVFG